MKASTMAVHTARHFQKRAADSRACNGADNRFHQSLHTGQQNDKHQRIARPLSQGKALNVIRMIKYKHD